MTKKKTEDLEVAMNVTEANDEEKKEVINASEEHHEEKTIEEVPATEQEAVEQTPKKKRTSKIFWVYRKNKKCNYRRIA